MGEEEREKRRNREGVSKAARKGERNQCTKNVFFLFEWKVHSTLMSLCKEVAIT